MEAGGKRVSDELEEFYRAAREQAREFVTLVKFAEEHGGEAADPHAIRGQIRQYVRDATDAQVWFLIEVLARSVAATYENLADSVGIRH
jgi:fermentation-respiration switch protein FrsA (DUF1100 family)